MKHTHHDDHSRAPMKQARKESPHRTSRADDFDDARPETDRLQPAGNGGGSGKLNTQPRLELSQASERNKRFLNPIQSFWPTPAA